MKRMKTFFVALWVTAMALIGVYYLAARPDETASEAENRALAPFPMFSFEGGFADGVENYLTDHFPLRENTVAAAQAFQDLLSAATFEDYLRMNPQVEDTLVGTDISSQIEELLSAPSPTPAPTPSPTPEVAPASAPESTDVPEPTEAPVRLRSYPEKEEAREEDFPKLMGVRMSDGSGKVTTLQNYSRSNILALTRVLDKVAAELNGDGALVFTMVPQSSYGNRYFKSDRSGEFTSDFEDCINAFGQNNVFAVSAANILGEAMKKDEYVYFRTDMHWTPYGTWLVYSQMLEAIGLEPYPYDYFNMEVEENFLGTYYRDNPSSYLAAQADTLEILTPPFALDWLRIKAPDTVTPIDFINHNAAKNDRYTVYLSGPAGPWTYADCDNDKQTNCLVICDSFGLAFVPMLCANYKQVHYYDPRYFSKSATGMNVAEMIEAYDITDCYVVVGDLHSFNSEFLISSANWQLHA